MHPCCARPTERSARHCKSAHCLTWHSTHDECSELLQLVGRQRRLPQSRSHVSGRYSVSHATADCLGRKLRTGVNTPAAGVTVDGITGTFGRIIFACPGRLVVIEGGAFSVGALLETDGLGRAVLHTTGTVVLRALESASFSGDLVQAVFAR
jgi:hypothetical protein